MTTSLKISILVLLIGLSSCAVLDQIVSMQAPKARVSDVKLGAISFDALTLNLDVAVNNPNSVGINLAGFDYDLKISNNSLVQGNQSNGLAIASLQESNLQVPVTINYQELYAAVKAVLQEDSTAYQVSMGIDVNVPVLGRVRVPVEHSGFLPILKRPRISISKLKLDNLSFTGAEFALEVEVDNPNAFDMALEGMDYGFAVNGISWISGSLQNAVSVSEKSKGMVRIPIKLNFLEVGRGVYQLITGGGDVAYSFIGDADLSSSLALLGDLNLPINKTGNINITR